ncbi:hypothetical protein LCGC14_1645230, partial [marine sediment metagenome]
LDLSIFDEWSPNLAWLLGYVWSDGSISSKHNSLSFCIQSADKELLLHVKHILHAKPSLHFSRKRNTFALQLYSAKLFDILSSKYGIKDRKSYRNVPFPHVPKSYLGHFLRGYVDGDGCVYNNNNNNIALEIYGQYRFIKGIQAAVCTELELQRNKVGALAGCFRITWYSKSDITKLYHFMYPQNNVPCLRRKRHKMYKYIRRLSRETQP